ncbi:MAG TPA: TetR/AcrR family transcriptional regulator [Gemmatimonadaceae bacterium]|nr:TetR/AcrR family transcriptional regulator [Gemmatimonadaceae bacterium]
MPWPKHHKAETRARIVAEAAAALRELGPERVAVAAVMDRAGLTHGGFYAHFGSKDELLADALAQASDESLAPLTQSAEAAADEDRWRAVVGAYLSPWHLTHVAEGCPVAALAPEVARAGGRLQRRLGQTIRARLEWLRSLLPGASGSGARRDDAAGALACMVGGLVLARALGGEDGRELLAGTRRFLERSLSDGARSKRA